MIFLLFIQFLAWTSFQYLSGLAGLIVAAPGVHLAGQTSPFLSENWNAYKRR
jgi:hypothetical protein